MKLLKQGLALALSLGVSVSAFAKAGSISGYFRVQNAGNSNFVEVTGPFTAKPNISEEDALYSAGTIMYIEAEQNGDSYVLTSLRCQGIDVVGEAIEPEDYITVLQNAVNSGTSPIYGLVQQGFLRGYTSVARATVGTVFWFVASFLEGYAEDVKKPDGTSYTSEDFLGITENFNKNVTANLDLGIRLKPVAGEKNTLQMYFDVPSLDIVSNWYTNPDNEVTFTAAMMAMREYLSKYDIDLEAFTANDVALFASWNYNVTEAAGVTKNTETDSEYEYTTSFQEIFKDPILLFNWIKWVGYMILNPEEKVSVEHNLAKMIDNLGFGDMLGSLNNHYLTNMLINYLPRLHYNTRAYLINGKIENGTWQDKENQLDFANETELLYAAKDNGNWVLVPVDNENGKFMVKLPVSWEDPSTEVANNYAAVYYDFPVTAAEETTVLNTLSSTKTSMGYEYVELEAITGDVPMQTAMVVQSQENEVQLLVANGTDIVFTPIDESLIGDEVNPEPEEAPENALQVTDEVEASNKQRINRRAAETGNEAFKGVLLPTPYFRIQDYWGFEPSETPVYSNFKNDQVLSSNHLLFENSANDLEANQAIYLYPNTSNNTMMVIIGAPTIEVSVGETDTKEEEPAENIKIAQGFTGNGANSFEGLLSLPADLKYGTDFTITMTAPTATGVDGSAAWTVPATPDDLSQSYLDAFLAIQPAPEGFTGSYTPGLYTQYESLFKDQSTVTVDGFYLDNLSATAESTGEVDESGNYAYNLNFDAPCSGIYQMTITGIGDYSGMTSGPHKIKIYPNLYGTFGADKGFNINGFSFTKIEEATASTGSFDAGDYVIYFPDDYDEAELASAIGYIPGTYFASSLSTDAPAAQDNDTDKSQVRRRAAMEYPSAYATTMDVSGYVDKNEALNVTVEKNGVSATYAFYLAKTTNPNNVSTGVESIEDGANGEAVYYNLQGVKVANPDKGIYVKVVNGKAEKVIL